MVGDEIDLANRHAFARLNHELWLEITGEESDVPENE